MEEASVAGESPDSSKQRESSEEPTSGSAGPVPEARTEASERSDPRLTVAREDAERSAGSGAGSRGGVDTATRVLSVRETEAGASGGDDGAGTPEAADASSDASEGDRAEPAVGNDGRLRDAVAAWVATADERAAANARLDDVRDAEDSSRDGDERAAAGADSEEDEAARQTAERPGTAADSDTDTDSAKDSDGATDAASGSDTGVDSASDPDEDSGAASSEGSGSAPVSDSDTDSDADAAPDTDAAPTTGSVPESDLNPKPDSGAGAAPKRDSAAAPASSPDTAPDAEAKPDSGTSTGVAPAPETNPKPGAGADAGPESGPASKPDTTPGAEAKATSGANPAPETKPEPGSGAEADPEPGSDSKAGSAPEAGAARGDDGGGGESPVDQPTAVFKAPRPAVDQPTTMLKLGDAAAASKKAGEADKAGPGDAERTSKFVALRNPDDPATRKPPRGPEAPPAQTPPGDAPKASQAPRTGTTTAVPHVGPDRTTQQPLPPKPPLDLLAELTNTPPPPETPLRTTVRRVKIWTPLVILLLIVFGVVQSMRPLPAPTLDLTAQDSFTFDGGKPEIPWPSSGQAALDVQGIGSFGSSGDQKPVPIASVAKVMTAYVILRDHPLKSGAEGPKIKIDQAAEEQSQAGQESTVNVFEGDSISQREALESILIASANNVARLLARWDAGSEKAFVAKMNAAAKDLGMTNSTYTDPSGLNNTTVSTAVDQVKLAKEAMKEPAFREVAAMMSYDDYKGVNHSNWNHLVGHNDVVGIKTGTTTSALGNLVFAAKKEVGGETRTIVGAVVRQPAGGADNTILGAALDSSDKLIRAAQDTLKSSTILKKGSVVGYVDDGLGGRTPVVATQDVKAVGWAGLTVKLTFTADEVPHTAKAGTKVGTLAVGDGGTSGAVKVPVALRDDLVEPGLSDKLTRLG
ncbi:D-alanyl-D-alanine carboxypeptidase [Streptomyces sp. M1013]|uniref:D-alanyl-D-alanine carboxypeptidase n=1 Tax=Streptomyces sp. M1013 TaxID=549798 RepID=UPI0015C53937|nr:D-alanyl-D-alanine carboxypeptidase [Streptomyces sp. M1013]